MVINFSAVTVISGENAIIISVAKIDHLYFFVQ